MLGHHTEEMAVNEDERKRLEATAYHEAGHAVVARVGCVMPFREVSIVPDEKEGSLGHVRYWYPPFRGDNIYLEDDQRTRTKVEKIIMRALAGGVAEEMYTGQENREGASEDLESAQAYAEALCHGYFPESEAHLQYLRARTKHILQRQWEQVEDLATALLERKRVKSKEVSQIWAAGIQRRKEAWAADRQLREE